MQQSRRLLLNADIWTWKSNLTQKSEDHWRHFESVHNAGHTCSHECHSLTGDWSWNSSWAASERWVEWNENAILPLSVGGKLILRTHKSLPVLPVTSSISSSVPHNSLSHPAKKHFFLLLLVCYLIIIMGFSYTTGFLTQWRKYRKYMNW